MSHSWFVNFYKDFNSDLPLWFIRWWTQFGSVTKIFPNSLVGSFQYFTNVFRVDVFPPLLHFIKKYKVPWILKWQYDKDGDVLTRRWYVKWWGKFPHTQAIVNNVTREFPSPNTLHAAKTNTPIQRTELAAAPTSTSAKTVKSSTKPKKKGFPLDEIQKDPDALYALIKMISMHNGQNATMFTPGEVLTIVLLLAHANDDVFKKEDSSLFWSPHAFFQHIWFFGWKNQTKPLLVMI